MDKSTNHYHILFDHAPIGIALIDTKGNILKVNNALLGILGSPSAEATKAINVLTFPPLQKSPLFSNIKTVLQEKKSISNATSYLSKWGKLIYVDYYLTPIFDGDKVSHILLYVYDLTPSQKKIKELTEINKKIVENLNEGVVLLDKQSHVLFANKQFYSFFELTDQNIIGKEIFSLIHIPNHEKMNALFEQIKQNPLPLQFEFEFKNFKQEQKFFLHEIYLINEDKESFYFVVIFHDITEQKRKEMELTESKEKAEQNNRIKSAFIANISHELRTPLNAITGFAGLLHRNDLPDEKKEQYIKQINASSVLLSRLIDDLIDITKIETGKLAFLYETIFLFPLLKEIQEQYHQELETRNKKHISLILDNTAQDDIAFYTDKLRLKQIISNLLLNAIKYTYQGEIHLGYKQYNNSVIFYVQDTGTGIKEEDIPLLFVPFMRIKNKYVKSQSGSGLGLTIVKNMVELMKGSIHVESEWMKGSTFSVRFPYEVTTVPEKAVKEEDTNNKKLFDKTITILIAEDDDINYMFLEEMLLESSLNLVRAHNGKEAVNMYKENADTIDIILMDIQMPVLDGFTATQLIKEINPDVPVIAQTAYAYSTELELSKKVGCVDYIVKPIQQDELLKKIVKYVK